MNTPNPTATALASTVLLPARASIHSGRMTSRTMPTMNTPTTSNRKICLTKRQASHNQLRQSSAGKRRA